MKKKLLILIPILIVFIGIYIYGVTDYADAIRKNWKINLPRCDKLVYYTDSGSSFNGDGERYSILQYRSKNKINKLVNLNWKVDKNDKLQLEIQKILINLKISNEEFPNYNKDYKYIHVKDDDSSELYILYFINENMIYTIENIF